MTPSYMTAVVGMPRAPRRPHPLDGLTVGELEQLAEIAGLELEQLAALSPDELEGIFDSIGKFLGGAAKTIGNAVIAPVKFVVDAADNIIRGQRIDRALMDAVGNQVKIFKDVAPIAQLGLSFIPGIGTTASAAIGAGLALAEGKPISDALIAGVKGAIPGGPLAQKALSIGASAAVDVAQGKRIDTAALDALRKELPGGAAARAAFDTGLALAQGKKLQEAGLAGAKNFLPKGPLAEGAFALTKQALAGKPIPGAPPPPRRPAQAQTARPPAVRAYRSPPARPKTTPLFVRSKTYDAGGSTSGWGSSPTPTLPAPTPPASPPPPDPKPEESSMVVPIALGAAALAAAGGGVWWLTKNRRTHP